MTHVLLVDDDFHVLDTLSRMVEHAGAVAVPCNGPCEALRALRERRFDLMITDYHMPELNGVELAMEALGHQKDLAVVVASGRPVGGRVRAAGLDFMPKPFVLDDVLDRIGSVMPNAAPGVRQGPSRKDTLR